MLSVSAVVCRAYRVGSDSLPTALAMSARLDIPRVSTTWLQLSRTIRKHLLPCELSWRCPHCGFGRL